MKVFILNSNSVISDNGVHDTILYTEPVKRVVSRFRRDVNMILERKNDAKGGDIVMRMEKMPAEQYRLDVKKDILIVMAGDELGFIYAFHYISEQYLGILPFWFWNDQKLSPKRQAEIPVGEYTSGGFDITYRGWFINDEVLISHWNAGVSNEYPWEMVFEALLRLGGNLVIPGTDKNSKIYAPLAADMGLIITHHHAEPLGAEMFARAYPQLTPSYNEHPDLFRKLWKEGIKKQKGQKVIWNLGFRGQGDVPFWENDSAYDTPEKRGELISGIIKEQYDMVKREVPDAVFCTNLYGEIMELFREGLLAIPEDVIMIWADNGYGKMVSRRQGNHNPRVPAIPDEKLKDKNHGMYYHVSFYDLQAANHITMLPNSMEFVEKELGTAYKSGIDKLWVINASNIKPHVYPLDFIANYWKNERKTAQEHRKKYLLEYYTKETSLIKKMKGCLEDYFSDTISYGMREDEHAGEQFYNYVTRGLIHGWMKNGGKKPCEILYWCAEKKEFSEQVLWYKEKCEQGLKRFEKLLKKCEEVDLEAGKLWEDSILLQVKLHLFCIKGAISFCEGYRKYKSKKYMDAFYLIGEAAIQYEEANKAMREREHGKWKDFYANDCLTDIKETAYCLERLMGYIRNLDDGPDFYKWQRDVVYSEEDKRVVLITNMENHMTDRELFWAMKEYRGGISGRKTAEHDTSR